MKKRYYWKKEDKQGLSEAQSFEDLLRIALRIAERMHKDKGLLAIVCGPISTGGVGTIRGNLKVFRDWISKLLRCGVPVFSQMSFEAAMHRIKAMPGNSEETLLERFYLPLFRSGYIRDFYFIPGWRTSFGATWEHAQAEELRLTIHYF